MSQDTVKKNRRKPWLCVCEASTSFHCSRNKGAQPPIYDPLYHPLVVILCSYCEDMIWRSDWGCALKLWGVCLLKFSSTSNCAGDRVRSPLKKEASSRLSSPTLQPLERSLTVEAIPKIQQSKFRIGMQAGTYYETKSFLNSTWVARLARIFPGLELFSLSFVYFLEFLEHNYALIQLFHFSSIMHISSQNSHKKVNTKV